MQAVQVFPTTRCVLQQRSKQRVMESQRMQAVQESIRITTQKEDVIMEEAYHEIVAFDSAGKYVGRVDYLLSVKMWECYIPAEPNDCQRFKKPESAKSWLAINADAVTFKEHIHKPK